MVETRSVEYDADDTLMVGHLALPDGEGPRPAVLIAHEANGLDDHQRGRAAQLAELGYVALAMDYHGQGRVYTDAEAMMQRITALGTDPARMRAIGGAALAVLTGEPRTDAGRVAAIGYCFGAVMMMALARSGADLRAVVGFHPGSADHDPDEARNIRGKVLMCIGADDPLMPPAARAALEDELRAAGVDWQINLYGGARHSFTHPRAAQAALPGLAYHEPADRRSWAAMLALFDETLT